MKFLFDQICRFCVAFTIFSALATFSFGQKLAAATKVVETQEAISASVVPAILSGNPGCQDLNNLHVNGSGDVRFAHITSNNELKLDFSTPNGTFAFASGGGVSVAGPQYPGNTITVSSSNSSLHSWASTIQITAVIVKVGNKSYVYPYDPSAVSDTGLITGSQNAISHLTFCYGQPTGRTTAADASITGRVVDANGNGIAKAQMVLVNGSTGETKITMTSPFGYYTFTDLDVSELYVLNVSHKRSSFTEKQRVVMLMEDALGIDFVSDPLQ